jgi:hypothetical protein
MIVDGFYDVEIGDSGVFGDLDDALANPEIWLEVVVDGTPLSPRERLTSVPYARQVHGLTLTDEHGVVLNAQAGTNAATGAFTTIGGGLNNTIFAEVGTISGGAANQAWGAASVIGGGTANLTSNGWSTVSGGLQNRATAEYATVAGGQNNRAQGPSSAVVGGGSNHAT